MSGIFVYMPIFQTTFPENPDRSIIYIYVNQYASLTKTVRPKKLKQTIWVYFLQGVYNYRFQTVCLGEI